MSEIIDFYTGASVTPPPATAANTWNFTRKLSDKIAIALDARRNDRFRKKINIQNLTCSYQLKVVTNNHDISVLKYIFDQVRYAKYSDINFGSLSGGVIDRQKRVDFEASRSSGLIHAGIDSAVSVVWFIDTRCGDISLLTAEEYF